MNKHLCKINFDVAKRQMTSSHDIDAIFLNSSDQLHQLHQLHQLQTTLSLTMSLTKRCRHRSSIKRFRTFMFLSLIREPLFLPKLNVKKFKRIISDIIIIVIISNDQSKSESKQILVLNNIM